jgi:hypothetical protein
MNYSNINIISTPLFLKHHNKETTETNKTEERKEEKPAEKTH